MVTPFKWIDSEICKVDGRSATILLFVCNVSFWLAVFVQHTIFINDFLCWICLWHSAYVYKSCGSDAAENCNRICSSEGDDICDDALLFEGARRDMKLATTLQFVSSPKPGCDKTVVCKILRVKGPRSNQESVRVSCDTEQVGGST